MRGALLIRVYGLDDRAPLVDTILWWQDRCRRGIEAAAEAGETAMVQLREEADVVPGLPRALSDPDHASSSLSGTDMRASLFQVADEQDREGIDGYGRTVAWTCQAAREAVTVGAPLLIGLLDDVTPSVRANAAYTPRWSTLAWQKRWAVCRGPTTTFAVAGWPRGWSPSWLAGINKRSCR